MRFKHVISVINDLPEPDDVLVSKIFYDLTMLIYNSITNVLFLKKSQILLNKVKGGETYKINHASNEGLAVIRHLGGWAIHSVIANLNRYILSFSASKHTTTQKKVTLAVLMREILCNSLTASTLEIHETSKFKETLQHTDYYNRGALTYITDDCYLFCGT